MGGGGEGGDEGEDGGGKGDGGGSEGDGASAECSIKGDKRRLPPDARTPSDRLNASRPETWRSCR